MKTSCAAASAHGAWASRASECSRQKTAKVSNRITGSSRPRASTIGRRRHRHRSLSKALKARGITSW